MAAELVKCPQCGKSDALEELGLRFTNQPVRGLNRDGDADEYDSFDYGDDVIVTGFGCRSCGWWDTGDLTPNELERLGKYADKVLEGMPAAD